MAAPRTRNGYLQAVRGFLAWCVQTSRLTLNPLRQVAKANEQTERVKVRRAMTEDELRRLLYVAQWRPLAEYGRQTVRKSADEAIGRKSWNLASLTMDTIPEAISEARTRLADNPEFVSTLELRGRERGLVYKTLVLTGLRWGELASITFEQLRLDGPTAFIELAAADEKNRDGSQIPLRSDLADDLRLWVSDRLSAFRAEICGNDRQSIPISGIPKTLPPQTPVFSVPRQLVKTLDRDLAAAGILKTDERGRSLDIHAMRTSFGTLCFPPAGCHPEPHNRR